MRQTLSKLDAKAREQRTLKLTKSTVRPNNFSEDEGDMMIDRYETSNDDEVNSLSNSHLNPQMTKITKIIILS